MEMIAKVLHEHGLKVTEARCQVMQTLMKAKGPLSTKEIVEKIGAEQCDPATVFRILKSLKEKNLIVVSFPDNKTVHYQIQRPKHGHHVTCVTCGKLEVLEKCCIHPMIKMAMDKGFTQISHRVEVFGVCARCT